MRRLAIAIGILIGLVLTGQAMAQQARVALVIGNAAYRHTGALTNPGNDAADVAAALRGVGFSVTELRDLDRSRMLEALRGFSAAADRAEVALLFYAGHAVQAPSLDRQRVQNWLLPVDARLAHEADLQDEAVSLDSVIARMAGARARVVLLDACRDNPLLEQMLRADRSRGGMPRGLGRTGPVPSGTLVAYATAPGETAADGRGRNSPFTDGLLRHIATPGMELGEMLQEVRRAVADATRPQQRPDIDNQLQGRIVLVPAMVQPLPPRPTPEAGLPPEAVDLAFWNSIATSRNPRDYLAYVETFPQGRFVRLARLRAEEFASAAPSPPPPDPAAEAQARADAEARARAEAEARRLAEDLRRQQEQLRLQQEELARQREELRQRSQAEASERARRAELERQQELQRQADAAVRAEADARLRREQQERQRRAEQEQRELLARTGTEATEAARSLTPANWRWIQEMLLALNHNVGVADGVPGPRTRAAIRSFQVNNGWPETGFLNDGLITLLERQGGPAQAANAARERAEREAEERERARRAAEPRERRAAGFAAGNLSEIAGCWRDSGPWTEATGYHEFCISGISDIRFSQDMRHHDGNVRVCSPRPGARLMSWNRQQITIELPQTQNASCRNQNGQTDFSRVIINCRSDPERMDRLVCDRMFFHFNSSEVFATDANRQHVRIFSGR